MIDIVNGTLRISVRNLVEFICRKGDIDNRFSGVTDKTAMDAGSRAHRKIQKSMGGDYNAEVSLSYTYDNDIYDITVEGRADGIFNKDGYTYVDEIKGTYKDVKYLSEPVEVHKAQAMCYAYIYALKNNVARLQEDHDNAAWMAKQLREAGADVMRQDTNMLFVRVGEENAAALGEYMKARNVLINASPIVRLVTHLDVSRAQLAEVAAHWRAFLAR